jgi:hypothetical protein
MPTRREFLTGLAIASLVGRLPAPNKAAPRRAEIWTEDHCLSQESAIGFRRLLNGDTAGNYFTQSSIASSSLIIAPGIRGMSLARGDDLFQRIADGTWVILESGVGFSSMALAKHQADLFKQIFDLTLLPPVKVAESTAAATYVEYTKPVCRLARTFEAITPIDCEPTEVIARLGGHSVCARKTVGRGGLVFLGSMLGPGLFAEEREALAIGAALVAPSAISSDLAAAPRGAAPF